MKIPDKFSNLSNSTLVVAAGAKEADLYVLENGRMVEKEEVRKESPVYSDREGFFARKGNGFTYGAGAVYEDTQKEKTVKSFLDDLSRHMWELAGGHTIDKVLLFAPAENFAYVKNAVPEPLKKRIAYEGQGNFSKHSILKLLQNVKQYFEKKENETKEASASPEAKKILRRGK